MNISKTEIIKKIDELQSPKGGWSKKSLEKLGVLWPPPKNWRRNLIEEGTGLWIDEDYP